MDIHSKAALACACVCVILVVASFAGRTHVHTSLSELVQHSAALHEASLQDSDVVHAFQHVTEALAYLAVARRLGNDEAILASSNVNPDELAALMLKHQGNLHARLSSKAATLTTILAGYK